ncbi:MAG: FAD-binding oxidoreductase [Gammaproteobacteria bacterium]|nr:FAD-binding oxidoreductase [Gammaproteobacteria bacterium]
MINEQTPIAFQDPLPKSVDVVVIGAGVIGMSTAWFLTRAGLDVLVCEKGRVAGEQSSRNWGWVRQQGRDPAELPIMMDSMRIWATLAEQTGEDLGFARHGVLYLADTDAELARYEQWLEIARQHQLDTQMLSAAQLDAMIPEGKRQWRGALYTPSDGRAEPFQAVPGLARAAQRSGCRIVENCAVRVIETQAGAVCGVITEHGPVKAQAVVCAAGVWSSLFSRNAGVDFPQLAVRSTVARTVPAPDIYNGNAAASDVAFRRRMDRGYTVALGNYQEHCLSADSFRYLSKFLPSLRRSWRDTRVRLRGGILQRFPPARWQGDERAPFERTRVLNPAPCPWAIAQIRARLARRLPALAKLEFAETWAGMIDVTPDIVPVIDESPSQRGYFVAAGFSGHGFGIGPGAGRVVADLVLGRPPVHDLHRFRLSRFSDGTRIEPGPAL